MLIFHVVMKFFSMFGICPNIIPKEKSINFEVIELIIERKMKRCEKVVSKQVRKTTTSQKTMRIYIYFFISAKILSATLLRTSSDL